MQKRIFSMILCVCMLIGMMSMPIFAADAVKAGEKATVVTDWQVFEKPDGSSKVTGYLSAGNEVDVLEAYISGKGGIDGRWHKISYTNKMLNLSGTGYVKAMYTSSKEAFKTEYTVEKETVYASVFVDTPLAGVKPYDDIILVDTENMTIDNYEWSGELDGNGCFKEGVEYTLNVTVSLKAEATDKVFSSRTADHMVNRFPPTIKLSDGNRTVELTYKFTKTKAPKESTAPKKEDSADTTSVKIDKLEPGDYGTMKLISGGYSIYHEPDSRTMYGNSQNTEATITVLEAGVDGIDTDAVYYAIWNERLEEVDYVNMNDAKATFGNFVKEGNDPERPYNEKFAEKRYKSKEITEIDVNFLHATVFTKPYMSEYGTEEPLTSLVNTDTYACTGVVYSTTEVPEPYSMVTATATYVAKDSYNFSKDVKTNTDRTFKYVDENGKHLLIVNTYSINHINEKTIELVYHVYIDPALPSATKPTQAMKDYYEKHKHERGVALPVIGTAKVSEHFSVKFDNNIRLIEPCLWKYPMDIDEDKYKIQPNQKVEIIDWDLTDEIPDINGDWCRIIASNRIGFVPKSYLTEVVMTDFWQGAPAVLHDSPYVFAGGSGTKEDPYLIETPEQLNAIRKDSAKYFKLIKDIDLSDWGNWIPIGGTPAYGGNGDNAYNKAQFGADSFRGQLDGNGHVISGMTIKINEEKPYMQEKSNDRYFGLMGSMSNGLGNNDAGIRNLGLINFNIDVTYSAYSETLFIWAGSFATHALDATITNCYTANGKINFNINKAPGKDLQTQFMFGGLASEIAGCTITKCFNDADITVKSNDKDMFYIIAGGLAADIQKSNISECYNSGDITLPLMDWGNGYSSVACGLFVYAEKYGDIKAVEHSTVTDCYNSGNLTANTVAGLAYYGRTSCNCAFTNCYNSGKFTIDEGIIVLGLPGKVDLVYLPVGTFTTNNCYSNGNSVSGGAWRASSSLGRNVLASIPEDSFTVPSVNAAASAPKAETVGNFVDVPVNAWYAEPVKWAVDKKITTGTSPTTFSPETTCTKAQIITFIWRAMGEPMYTTYNRPFTDVTYKDYYSVSSWWAQEKGMVDSGTFGADKLVTRADTVVYLWKMAGSPDVGTVGTFTDVPQNADYAKAVAWAVQSGITSGTSATTFSPDMTCTRGHIVTFLQRAVK